MKENLSKEEIQQILSEQYIMRIGCRDHTKMYVFPVTFGYDKINNCLISHSGPGTKINAMKLNPDVCFEVEKIESISNWQTVMGWGKFEQLHGADIKNAIHFLVEKARKLISDDNHPEIKYLRDISSSTAKTDDFIAYRINISEFSGKSENR